MKRKRWVWGIAIVLGVFFIAAGILIGPLIYYAAIRNPFNDQRFDRAVWAANTGKYEVHNPRGPMADDLRSRYLHKGMSKACIRKFLGRPDEVAGYDDMYILGAWGFLSIDYDYLLLRYNRQGQLSSARIYSP